MTELFADISSLDFLHFKFHTISYSEELQKAQKTTKQLCGVKVKEHDTHLVVEFNFRFMGGSLGCAETQKIVLASQYCEEHKKNLVIKIASGGVRMQEGVSALQGMSICCCQLQKLRKTQLVITVLQDPCYGGAAASFARAADIVIAEKRARIGFAGPEVIKNTIFQGDQNKFDQLVGPGFETAEKMAELGQLDMLLDSESVDTSIETILSYFNPQIGELHSCEADSTSTLDQFDFEECRDISRPQPIDYIKQFGKLEIQVNTQENIECWLGQANELKVLYIFTHKSDFTDPLNGLGTPVAYRNAGKAAILAGKLQIPVVTIVDTSGALPSPEAEIADQSLALQQCLSDFAATESFILSVITGEGGSGGALALVAGNCVACLERSFYNVISPEGGVSILAPAIYKGDKAAMKEEFQSDCKILARAQKCYPRYLQELGVIDSVIPGWGEGCNAKQTALNICQYIFKQCCNFRIWERSDWKILRESRMLSILTYDSVADVNSFLANINVQITEKPKIVKVQPTISQDMQLILHYIAEKSVGRAKPKLEALKFSKMIDVGGLPDCIQFGQILRENGPRAVVDAVRECDHRLFTETSLRDAHQSILATRLRGRELYQATDALNSTGLLQKTNLIFSEECWGGATFDTCLRFLQEDPFERLRELKRRLPNTLTQMLLRGKNVLGYGTYPDNVIEKFIVHSANAGLDVFRVFDAFNCLDRMDLCVRTILNKTSKICEVCVCYTGLDEKFNIEYYTNKIGEIKSRWPDVHLICLKDMAGLLQPDVAEDFFTSIVKAADPVPIHYHTHDTSGVQSATALKAFKAGVKIVDVATCALAGLSSQPPMQSLLYPLLGKELNQNLQFYDSFFSVLRTYYKAEEKALNAPTAQVYTSQMPGGQLTNLHEQCTAMGLGEKWDQCAQLYAEANQFLGKIIKVTPSSKVVGDLALFMLENGMESGQELEGVKDLPVSAVKMLQGDLGQPYGGFPAHLVERYKQNEEKALKDVDFSEIKSEINKICENVTEDDIVSYCIYPDLFTEYKKNVGINGSIHLLPVDVFLYGMMIGESIEINSAKITLLRIHAAKFDRTVEVDFQLNDQVASILIKPVQVEEQKIKMASGNDEEVACDVLGIVQEIIAHEGSKVKPGDALFRIASSKLEIVVSATNTGVIKEIAVEKGQKVVPGCLLGRIE